MSRTKTGFVRRRWHNKVRKMVRGQFGSRGTLWKRSSEAMLKSLFYSYRDRKQRARRLRELWIVRINAAARMCGMSYSRLINGLTKAGIKIDRKVLADLAVHDMVAFKAVAEQAKAKLVAA